VKIQDSVVLVTGANRGLGKAFARALVERGATVYAGARDPLSVADPDVRPVALDVTDPESVTRAAESLRDVTIVINNAGILRAGPPIGAASVDDARAEMEVNYFGPLQVSRAFAPVLAANGGGALVNVLSALSFTPVVQAASYSASKSAAWSLTRSVRDELREQGTLVVAVHAGFIDTDMAKGDDAPKTTPEDVVAQVLDAIEQDREEVLADQISRDFKASLSAS